MAERAYRRMSVAAAVAGLLLAGCAGGGGPPKQADCDRPPNVALVDHGRHLGLVVERAALVRAVPALDDALPAGDLVEIGWGDAEYYQTRNPGLWLTLRAALWPTHSVLHLAVTGAPPARAFPGADIVRLALAPSAHRTLLDFVGASLVRDAEDRLRRLGPPLYGDGGFFAARDRFHLFNNCNNWVARGLARASIPVSDAGLVTAGSLMSRLAPFACPVDRAASSP